LDSWKANSKAVLPEYTEKEIKEIIDKIYDPQYGARPVERYIHDTIEPEIIQKIMER